MNYVRHLKHPVSRLLAMYLAAVVLTYLLASATATQAVVASLSGMGVEVGAATRLSMTLRDLAGMAGSLLPMVAAGLLVAFPVAALLGRRWPRRRTLLYVLAGAAAMLALHGTLKLVLGITPIAIARSAGGLAVQALAGAIGGWLFARLLSPNY